MRATELSTTPLVAEELEGRSDEREEREPSKPHEVSKKEEG
jgi:hypothetical protein